MFEGGRNLPEIKVVKEPVKVERNCQRYRETARHLKVRLNQNGFMLSSIVQKMTQKFEGFLPYVQ